MLALCRLAVFKLVKERISDSQSPKLHLVLVRPNIRCIQTGLQLAHSFSEQTFAERLLCTRHWGKGPEAVSDLVELGGGRQGQKRCDPGTARGGKGKTLLVFASERRLDFIPTDPGRG